MTPKERAEKIVAEWIGYSNPNHDRIVKAFAAHISEAEGEAASHNEFKSHLDEPFRCPDCFTNGFRAAKTKAAGVVREKYFQAASEDSCAEEWLAASIEAMEP